MPRVAVTGIGAVSGLGHGAAANWRRARDGDGAIAPLVRTLDGTAARIDGPAAPAGPPDLAAAAAHRGGRALAGLDPLAGYAAQAGFEAVAQAGLLDDPALAAAAVLVGCGSGGNASFEAGYHRLFARGLARVHPQTIPAAMVSAPASRVAMLLGIRGPALAISSACASSAHALGEAMHMIRAGRVAVALAGGAEACLTIGSWAAWASLGVLADDSCRPFSAGRRGLVLGEGAAMLVLEAWDHARARGAPILAELCGYGATSDAAHLTAPDRAGVEAAIRAAHRDAALPTDAPVLVSAHGTGTVLNDATEAAALHAVYGAAIARDLVIATKSAHGHLIGGAAALEFAIGLVALAEGVAPPVLNHAGPDPACALPLALAPVRHDHEWLVSNSFAFGGLNAVLVGRRA